MLVRSVMDGIANSDHRDLVYSVLMAMALMHVGSSVIVGYCAVDQWAAAIGGKRWRYVAHLYSNGSNFMPFP